MPRPSAEAEQPPVRRHLLLCATPSKPLCHDDGTGAASWERLKALLRSHGLDNPDHPAGVVLRSKVDCLRYCQGGPVLLVWPEGIWYGGVTPERIERIVADHLLGDRPVDDWIVRRTSLVPPAGNG